MLFITIFHQDISKQSYVEKMIKTVAKHNNIKIKSINSFGNTHDLLHNLTSHGTHGIYFIDIDVSYPEPDGLALAQKIRRCDSEATIILLTSHLERILSTFNYKIEAMDFIYTAVTDQILANHLTDIFHEVMTYKLKNQLKDTITFRNKHSILQIPFDDILYIETASSIHKVVLHTKHNQYEFYSSLGQVLQTDYRLFKCHKSYVVNPNNIIKIDRENKIAHFDNGESCLISRQQVVPLIEIISKKEVET